MLTTQLNCSSTELLLGAESYGFAIDIWSGGCVLAEMIAGDPVFKGEEIGMDQLVEIICVLGTITEGEMEAMGTVLPSLDDKVLASRSGPKGVSNKGPRFEVGPRGGE